LPRYGPRRNLSEHSSYPSRYLGAADHAAHDSLRALGCPECPEGAGGAGSAAEAAGHRYLLSQTWWFRARVLRDGRRVARLRRLRGSRPFYENAVATPHQLLVRESLRLTYLESLGAESGSRSRAELGSALYECEQAPHANRVTARANDEQPVDATRQAGKCSPSFGT
jgi:hypothetical protein